MNKIFEQYQSSPGRYAFDKTEVHVRLFTMGTIYISRSQARRLLFGLEKFKKIIFDFDRVPNVGQAFADEIFRVFQGRHPEISIEPVNMNETVRFMVARVEKPNYPRSQKKKSKNSRTKPLRPRAPQGLKT